MVQLESLAIAFGRIPGGDRPDGDQYAGFICPSSSDGKTDAVVERDPKLSDDTE